MPTPILLLNTVCQMQSTLGAAKTITAISKASAAVVTATHDFSAGDYVVFDTNIGGMVEMNGRVCRVLSVSTTVSFVCEALDSSAFSTYTSGGSVYKVTAFHTFDNLTSFNYPEPAPTRIDVTTVHDTIKKEVFGLDESPNITMSSLSNPTGTVMAAVKTAALAKTTRAFKVTLQNGNILIFNAYVAGGRGLDGSAGAVATGQINLTLAAPEQYFAS